ncbi:UDP-N-acetylmuramate dehydrogenase [Paenibacillus sp. FSL L8-0493]|jgi:UDP-N-acetylmuramate dehydrogenase|uniref:UDP-N-acetylenolpyruvoylglucosamine reductase n=1 Tax=Paenibacillus odorifer TaxID=189426 RepID=A0ABX3H1E6_9BACL|nr:UDP-N-acetylmuramate dehydrogenase [Paenibacillus odorifer]OMC80826.1 UDP-N-acetylenolpyruvoylglucosamine reductase [Paenibacillus odorifer]OMC93963.1 UDP-N-acetylenolpyruvoylglucosamine reductase [Paenibacillus odorifer]OMD28618.1 UDP-N-acetylenolpyruvoylglucosamine reductase [Paenibacillus odorifer]OMD39962.1 UDP-N-acetylenolpyruvoylglucosamine reductase [Paenibacillus odorifer]OMD78201.1 UDP-N-acetylenolpyruvoylglucosamine reductase [Paenibacillus odorifer]
MNIDKIQDDLEQLMTAGIVKSHENLKDHVYTKMGGKADILAAPATYDEIQKIVTYAEQNGITLTVLGNGSNVIIRDGGVRGIVLQTAGLTEMGIRDNLLYAQCGAKIIDVSRYALDKELTGLEFACGIPGTVGGALYMNAGAYGGEIKDVLHSALAINKNGQLVTLQGDELQWGYRKSVFASGEYIVLEAKFAMTSGDVLTIKAKMDELTYLRESKQPLEYPSCGSVFKRPPGRFAGQLIQESGLQGTRIGGAEVSKKHAGFIVNADNATASDYIGLIHHVRATVKDKFGVELETEVEIIGEE